MAILADRRGGEDGDGGRDAGEEIDDEADAIAADTAHAIVTLPADAATRADVARRIAQWQHDGDIAHVALIETAATGSTTDGSALVFLDAPSERAWGRWMRRSAPAFADTVDVRRADVLRASGDGQHTHAAAAPAVKVKIDQPTVPRADDEHFVDAYVTLQLQGERHAGGLLDDTLYLEHDVAGPALAAGDGIPRRACPGAGARGECGSASRACGDGCGLPRGVCAEGGGAVAGGAGGRKLRAAGHEVMMADTAMFPDLINLAPGIACWTDSIADVTAWDALDASRVNASAMRPF